MEGKTPTRERPAATQPPAEPRPDDAAARYARRLRRLKRRVVWYALTMLAVTPLWVLVERQDNGSFQRLSADDQPGSWDPSAILWLAGIWGLVLLVDAIRVRRARPATQRDGQQR